MNWWFLVEIANSLRHQSFEMQLDNDDELAEKAFNTNSKATLRLDKVLELYSVTSASCML